MSTHNERLVPEFEPRNCSKETVRRWKIASSHPMSCDTSSGGYLVWENVRSLATAFSTRGDETVRMRATCSPL